MIIFEEPKYLFVVGIILAVVFFMIQLLLCFKARQTNVKRIPVYFILLCGLLCFMLFIGAFGSGSGGVIANVNQLIASILAIVVGIALIGVVTAWIVYKICIRRRK